MARHKVGILNEIGGTDGFFSKTEMGPGYSARFFTVVFKICLHIQTGMIADNLYGVLVCSHSSIGTESPEFAADRSVRHGVNLFPVVHGQMCNIIPDTNGVMVFRRLFRHVPVHGNDLGRRKILTGQSVAAGVYADGSAGLQNYGADVFVKGLSCGSRLLRPVSYCDFPDGFRQLA